MNGEVKYAGFWLRFAALLLDGVVIIMTSFAFQSLMPGGTITPPDLSEAIETIEGIPQFLSGMVEAFRPFLISNSIFFLIVVLYWVILTWKFGATLGKMAMGIKVVREDLKPISFGGAIVREFLVKQVLYGILFFISWLGYLWVSWDSKKQGWHDKIARTLVIKESETAEPSKPAEPVKPVEPLKPLEPIKPPQIDE